jgi:fibronectin-binding autotransporter adhesin
VGNEPASSPAYWAPIGLSSAPVSSVFGRTGAVAAQSGDYTAAQVGLGNVLNVAQEPALGNPSENGEILSSTTAGVRSWIVPPSAPVSSVFGRTGAITAQPGDYTAVQVGAEPTLGDPLSNGQVVSSTSAGVRSWISVQAPITGAPASWPSTWAWSALTGIPSLVNSFNSRSGAVTPASGDYTAAMVGLGNVLNVSQEPALGAPAANGYLLSSTTTGVRSWVAPPTGGGLTIQTPTLSNSMTLTMGQGVLFDLGSLSTLGSNVSLTFSGGTGGVGDYIRVASGGYTITWQNCLNCPAIDPTSSSKQLIGPIVLGNDGNYYVPGTTSPYIAAYGPYGSSASAAPATSGYQMCNWVANGLGCANANGYFTTVAAGAGVSVSNGVLSVSSGGVTNAMLAGSIATSKLASLQGSDSNVLTAGTISGTGATLCTDSNGGATTSGCSSGGGEVPVTVAPTGPVSDPGGPYDYLFNNSGGALTFNLPAAVAGMQRCYGNSVGTTGAITITAASGNTIALLGANSAAAGSLTSGGAAGDGLCLASDAANHWMAYPESGTWSNGVTSLAAPLRDPGANGIVKRTALGVTAAAGYADVVGLFGSGSCSGYLNSSGTCSTPGGSMPTEVNGDIIAGVSGSWTATNSLSSGTTLNGAPIATAATGGSLTTSGAFGVTLTATAATNVTLPVSGTLSQTVASGSGLAIGVTSLGSDHCTGDSGQPATVTATATGVLTTDVVQSSPNTAFTSSNTGFYPASGGGVTVNAYISAANTVAFQICNWTASAISPVLSVNWRVTR